ncbi:hypothetical protein GGR54DRAFT_598001 [Hypoxylon sp. NC1633]|nr:hypothetical protein GGR54DRAFT_598001 [Hypoxylon sp. NC1633]
MPNNHRGGIIRNFYGPFVAFLLAPNLDPGSFLFRLPRSRPRTVLPVLAGRLCSGGIILWAYLYDRYQLARYRGELCL